LQWSTDPPQPEELKALLCSPGQAPKSATALEQLWLALLLPLAVGLGRWVWQPPLKQLLSERKRREKRLVRSPQFLLALVLMHRLQCRCQLPARVVLQQLMVHLLQQARVLVKASQMMLVLQ